MIPNTLIDLNGDRLVHFMTRAKSNVVGYDDPPPKTCGKERPEKYGNKVKLIELFEDKLDDFQKGTIEIYGEAKTVLFLCLDLIWKPVGEKVGFVLVIDGKENFILMCSNLALSPQDIITADSYRFKIEVNFKVLKHLIGVFSTIFGPAFGLILESASKVTCHQ